MTRSYDVDIALKLGGVAEAVVLREIAFWCDKNAAKGLNQHDGRTWTYNTQKQWQEKFPEFKNIRAVLKSLEDGGWIVSGVYNKIGFDRTKWYALTDNAISMFPQMDLQDSANGFEESSKPIPTEKPISKQSIEEILKKNADAIERLYALYPGKTKSGDRGERSTGKCSKDKHRIAALLRTHTPEQIERSIRKYVEEQGGMYLKNFSTFLNNLPEYGEEEPVIFDVEEQVTGQDWK